MTSYLDDIWLQAEVQRFEDTKRALQEAAALLERATTATPQLQRGLEQLDSHEKKTRRSLDQLTSEKRQELASVVKQAQAEFDGHVDEVIRKLMAVGEPGQLLELRQEVSGLLKSVPVLERQAARLAEDMIEVQEHYPARLMDLEGRVMALQDSQTHSSAQVAKLVADQERHLTRLNQLSGQDTEFKAALGALHANQKELQKAQQQLQSHQQSQGATIQRTVQQLSELENAGKRSHTELSASLGTLSQQISEALGGVSQLESRQTAAEARLEQLEVKLFAQITASQNQLEDRLLSQLTAWREESQEAQQQVGQRLEQFSALPQQLSTLDSALKESRSHLDTHRTEASARHDGQREALSDLERQLGAVQTRATRFIAWFEKASALTRLRGTPE